MLNQENKTISFVSSYLTKIYNIIMESGLVCVKVKNSSKSVNLENINRICKCESLIKMSLSFWVESDNDGIKLVKSSKK